MTVHSPTRAPGEQDGRWTGHLDTGPSSVDGDPFDLLGDVLDERFRVDAFVGEGDLSVVYKGHDLSVDAPVLIKCLNLPETLDPALTRPVFESFDAANRLHLRLARGSRHIARIIASGRTMAPRTGTNVPYQVREWFDGESLASDLARRQSGGNGARSVEETVALLEPAIEGIAYAHEQGVAHLVLNPDNLFVARTDHGCSLKVLDFGAARPVDHSGADLTGDSPFTRGLQLLRPAYAAPEQLDRTTGRPGTWTDVYALALIMMEVLSGRDDTQGADTPALVARALDDRKRPTPEAHGLKLPRSLDLALTRAVSRSPEGRQRDARIFWRDVKTALRASAATAPPALRAVPAVNEPPPLPARPEPPRIFYMPPLPAPTAKAPPAPAAEAAPPQPLPAPPDPIPLDVVAPEPAVSAPDLPASVFPPAPRPPPPLVFDSEELAPLGSRWSSRKARAAMVGGAAALLATAALAVVLTRRPTPAAQVVPPLPAPATSTVAAAAVPVPVPPPMAPPVMPSPAPVTTSVARPAAAAAAPAAAVAAHSVPPPSPAPHHGHFSAMAARRALFPITPKVARCRHGKYWGSGYATLLFRNDGTVEHVLIDPPFSRTVAGKCVAEAFSTAHIPSFDGKPGLLRLRFNIARH